MYRASDRTGPDFLLFFSIDKYIHIYMYMKANEQARRHSQRRLNFHAIDAAVLTTREYNPQKAGEISERKEDCVCLSQTSLFLFFILFLYFCFFFHFRANIIFVLFTST